MCMTDSTYTPPLAPPEFEHAMRQAAYQLRRANGFDAPEATVANNATVEMDSVNTDGERAIAPRDDCSVAPIPKHGFSGS